jgi:riboflavin synthase
VFTGIVERLGRITSIKDRPGSREIVMVPREADGLPPFQPVVPGESISVSGVCLTAARISMGGPEVGFDVVPETLSRTSLGGLRTGDPVNIERSLAVGDLLGGHFVTGHIDGVGTVLARNPEGDQVLFQIGAPEAVLEFVIPKGSVAVDGVSLTVVEVRPAEGWFSFAAIPHTLEVTTLGLRKLRDPVNLEGDAFGKWVIHGLRRMFGAGPPPGWSRP